MPRQGIHGRNTAALHDETSSMAYTRSALFSYYWHHQSMSMFPAPLIWNEPETSAWMQVARFETPPVRGLLRRAPALQLGHLANPPSDTGRYHQQYLLSYTSCLLPGLTSSVLDNPLERAVPLMVKPSAQEAGIVPCRWTGRPSAPAKKTGSSPALRGRI